MKSYSLQTLQHIVGGNIVGNESSTIKKIYFDSRKIVLTKGAAFVAILGNKDGHAFIKEAYNKGIRVFVCSSLPIDKYPEASFLVVENTLVALQTWAKSRRLEFQKPLIGITGSNGKTLVKEWLFSCLQSSLSIYRSPKSYNSQIGVPISVLEAPDDQDIYVFEAGISFPGEMEKLYRILTPNIGVLTNIGDAHLENFQDAESLLREKLILFESADVVVLPDDSTILSLFSTVYPNKKTIVFGDSSHCTIKLIKVVESQCYIFDSITQKTHVIPLPSHDKASIHNILCVVGIIRSLDLQIEDYIPSLSSLEPIEMRLEIVPGKHNCVLINDSFSFDVTSLTPALDVLFQQTEKKKQLILSDIDSHLTNKSILYNEIKDLVDAYEIDMLYLVGKEIGSFFENGTIPYTIFENSSLLGDYLEKTGLSSTAILFKGARKFQLEDVVRRLEEKVHDTVLHVNLHGIIENLNYFKSLITSETKIMAMVKANAYGLGIEKVSEILAHYGVDYFGVAYADEGAVLRKNGISTPIIVMNPEQNSFDTIVDFQLEPVIYSERVWEKFESTLKKKGVGTPFPIHIKVDTGMHRLGFSPNEVFPFIESITKKNVEIKSIFSHLSSSDDLKDKDYTMKQLADFNTLRISLQPLFNTMPLFHILNSNGVINYADYAFDMVRLGYGLYGFSSDEEVEKSLQTVVTFKTVISQIREIEPGESISYNRKYKSKRKERIATLPVGYADGIHRSINLHAAAYVLIHNTKAPIIGSVCMDMMMVNVTDIDCREGDTVTLFGEDLSVKEYASWFSSIAYEALCSISSRVKRIYYRE